MTQFASGVGPSALLQGAEGPGGSDGGLSTLRSMRVLLMDSHPGSAGPASDALLADGHQVVRCRDQFAPTQPCAGFDGVCPIDVEPVDVALDVRGRPLPRPTAGEHGVVCASRAGIPVVVAGQVAFQPFEPLTTVELVGTSDVTSACEAAVAAAEDASCQVVADAVQAATGCPADVEWRSGDGMFVTIHGGTDTGRTAVRAHQAARAVDRDARTITVRTS
jgi:hypothetical protein